jgi:hypothetical protein
LQRVDFVPTFAVWIAGFVVGWVELKTHKVSSFRFAYVDAGGWKRNYSTRSAIRQRNTRQRFTL